MKTKHLVLIILGVAVVAIAARYFYYSTPAVTPAVNPPAPGVQTTVTGAVEPVVMPSKPVVVISPAPAV